MRCSMSKVLPGLYIGNILDAQNVFKDNAYNITHVISLRSNPRRLLRLYHYLHLPVADERGQNISQYFSLCNDVIHRARLENTNHNVLVHCYAGISRSATIVLAYLMTVGNLKWDVAWRALRSVRPSVRPNPHFQEQLKRFQKFGLKAEQRRLYNKYPSKKLRTWDLYRIEALLNQNCYGFDDFYPSQTARLSSTSTKNLDDDEDNFYDCLSGEEGIDGSRQAEFNFLNW